MPELSQCSGQRPVLAALYLAVRMGGAAAARSCPTRGAHRTPPAPVGGVWEGGVR